MPQAAGRSIHIDVPLTNVALNYRPTGMIADLICPVVPVPKQSNLYPVWDQGDIFRSESDQRAPGTEAKLIHRNVSSDNYFCRNYALKMDLTLEDSENAVEAYIQTLREGRTMHILDKLGLARAALRLGITELHIVGGLHPSLPFSYYTGLLQALRALSPALQLKCFTAIEILHLSWLAKKTVAETLGELRAAGLDSLNGGGAEIFQPDVRAAIARGKESAEEYLEVHRTWHRLGGRSTCTMLYGHVESLADRVDHLRRLRELQDETKGFVGFVPLPYQPENNAIPVDHPPTGF